MANSDHISHRVDDVNIVNGEKDPREPAETCDELNFDIRVLPHTRTLEHFSRSIVALHDRAKIGLGNYKERESSKKC